MAGAWFRGAFNREPAMMISAIVAGAAIALPAVIVPIRRKMGLPTYQWDGVASTNPYLHDYAEELQQQYRFDDAQKLAQWSQHDLYRFRDRLPQRAADDPERDFPQARERMSERAAAVESRLKKNRPATPPPAASPLMRDIPDPLSPRERDFPGMELPEERVAREKREAAAAAAAEREA